MQDKARQALEAAKRRRVQASKPTVLERQRAEEMRRLAVENSAPLFADAPANDVRADLNFARLQADADNEADYGPGVTVIHIRESSGSALRGKIRPGSDAIEYFASHIPPAPPLGKRPILPKFGARKPGSGPAAGASSGSAGTMSGSGQSGAPNTSGNSIFGGGGGNAPSSNSNLFGKSAAPSSGAGLFGNTSTTGSAPSLFGNQSSAGTGTGTGLFGGAATTPAGEQKNPFGGAGSSNLFNSGGGSGTSFSFGNKTNAPATSGAPASQPGAPTTSLFGNPSSGTTGGFGQTQSSTNANTSSAAPQLSFGNLGGNTGGNSLFGGNNQNATSGANPFGGKAPAATTPSQEKSASNLFGGGAGNSSNAGSSLFQAPAPQQQAPSSNTASTPQANKPNLFSQPSTTPAGNPPASTSLFGGPKPSENQPPPTTAGAQSQSLFGNAGGSTGNSGGGLFGANQQAQGASSAPQGASAPTSTPAANAQPQATSLFTTNAQTGSGASAGGASLFGNTGNGSGASATSLFGGSKPTSSAPSGANTTSAPASLFAKPAAPASSSTSQPANPGTSAPTNSFSNLFGAAASTTAGSMSQAPTSTATSGPALGGGLFGGASAAPPTTGATSTTATTAPTTAAPASGAPSSLFGATGNATASTSGPAPPAHSRLAQKSMDEIITMWSTSLASHQKTFKALASQISTWDQMLVQNSSKISTLYTRCFQAERDCGEVERQLSVLENGQAELDALLDRYENDVDKMIEQSGGGADGAGGVDGERERTYKTAEACSSRLTDMSHSLTDMIEEINAATSKLSSDSKRGASAVDDPLSQIVRVLNSHLSQLQTIDAGASDLKDKVEAAQKEQRALGQSQGVNGGAWLDDFGRSYLGRR